MENDLKSLKKLFNSLKPIDGEPCVYCGLLATENEHVFPKSWLDQLDSAIRGGINIEKPKQKIVRSCKECNLIASDRVFNTFTEKKKYIRERLIKKYRKFMGFKLWTDNEINELSGRLREQVFFFNEIAKIMRNRIEKISK